MHRQPALAEACRHGGTLACLPAWWPGASAVVQEGGMEGEWLVCLVLKDRSLSSRAGWFTSPPTPVHSCTIPCLSGLLRYNDLWEAMWPWGYPVVATSPPGAGRGQGGKASRLGLKTSLNRGLKAGRTLLCCYLPAPLSVGTTWLLPFSAEASYFPQYLGLCHGHVEHGRAILSRAAGHPQ